MGKFEDFNALIYGRHPVVDAIKTGRSIDKVILQKGMRGEVEVEIRNLCKKYQLPLQYIPKERLEKLTKGNNHQGVLAYLSLAHYYSIEELLPSIIAKGKAPLLLILDGITDIRNFGAIARSAEIAGVDAIIVHGKGAAPVNGESMKASAGALAKIPVCREQSLAKVITFLQMSDIEVFASDLKAEKYIYETDFTQAAALIIGSEGKGISNYLLKAADEAFIIPQVGTTDSFNVSVATGIMLYEVMRQRTLMTTN